MNAVCSPQEAFGQLADLPPGSLVDVRTPAEFREVHAVGAVNHPLDGLNVKAFSFPCSQGSIYLICRSGQRAEVARRAFEEHGMADRVQVINGGTDAWVSAGQPVVRGAKSLSLERQVRIAAGSLVLLGVVLSVFVHPYALGLSAFVGAGLIFAGITDTCGMGMLLARMPWNR